jgi:hypothetical protein
VGEVAEQLVTDHCAMDHAHMQTLSALLLALAPVLIALAGVAKLF